MTPDRNANEHASIQSSGLTPKHPFPRALRQRRQRIRCESSMTTSLVPQPGENSLRPKVCWCRSTPPIAQRACYSGKGCGISSVRLGPRHSSITLPHRCSQARIAKRPCRSSSTTKMRRITASLAGSDARQGISPAVFALRISADGI